MYHPIKNRSLWVVLIIDIYFGPAIAMLYINRWKIACAYWLAFLLVFGWPFIYPISILNPDIDLMLAASFLVAFLLWFAGLAHAIVLARGRGKEEPLAWYSRWYFLPVAALLFFFSVGMLMPPTNTPIGFYTVPSESMVPTVNPGDGVVAYQFMSLNAPIERGDLIVFREKLDGPTFLKRIVGLPGDRIQMVQGQLLINGVAVQREKIEPFLQNGRQGTGVTREVDQYRETLPDGRSYRVIDLKQGLPLDDTEVYLVPANEYFVLGDNRDNAIDSRIPTIGFVKFSQIKGRVAWCYWNGATHWFDFSRVE